MRYKFPHIFRDADVGSLPPALVEQVKLSILLGYGFAFSLFPLGGVGSLVAFVIGWLALGRINRSGEQLAGWMLAYWCIVVGGFLMVFVPVESIAKIPR